MDRTIIKDAEERITSKIQRTLLKDLGLSLKEFEVVVSISVKKRGKKYIPRKIFSTKIPGHIWSMLLQSENFSDTSMDVLKRLAATSNQPITYGLCNSEFGIGDSYLRKILNRELSVEDIDVGENKILRLVCIARKGFCLAIVQ